MEVKSSIPSNTKKAKFVPKCTLMCPLAESESRLKSNEIDMFEVIIDSNTNNNLSFNTVKENKLFNTIPNLTFN